MLKTTYDRSYSGSRPHREPESWQSRSSYRQTEPRREPAPWRQPFPEERPSARDYARRASRRSGDYGGSYASSGAGYNDFRDLARSIEELRERRRLADGEPRERASSSRPETPRRESRSRTDDVRKPCSDERRERAPSRQPSSLEARQAKEIARLEEMVNALQERVLRLEEARPSSHFAAARERAEAIAAEHFERSERWVGLPTSARSQRATKGSAESAPPRAGHGSAQESGPRRLWP